MVIKSIKVAVEAQSIAMAANPEGDNRVKFNAGTGCLMLMSIPADVAIFYLIYLTVKIL